MEGILDIQTDSAGKAVFFWVTPDIGLTVNSHTANYYVYYV